MKSIYNIPLVRTQNTTALANLGQLLDVSTVGTQDGQGLVFDNGAGKWTNKNIVNSFKGRVGEVVPAVNDYRLDMLADVDVSGLQSDSILFFDGEYWIDALHVLTRLNDVVISGPQNNQVLTYNSTAGEWQNKTAPINPIITNPLLWDTITYNGSEWVNAPSVSLLAVTNFLDYFNISATDTKGDITLTFTPAGKNAHTVFSVGGSFANPSFRLLEVADLPALSLNNLSSVNIGTPATNDLFLFNGTNWTNSPNANYLGSQANTNQNPVNMSVNYKYFGSGNSYALPISGIYNGARVLISSINGGNNGLVVPNGVYFCGATNESIIIGPYSFIEAEFHSTGWELISAGGTITGLTSGILYPPTLSAHSNVNINTPTDNEILKYNAGSAKWVNSTVTLSTDMSDVFIENPISGQALAFNGSAWENTTLNTSNISDISITTPANGDILIYNSTSQKWENGNASRCLAVGEVYSLGDGTTANRTLTAANTWYIFDTVASTLVTNPSGALVFDSPAISGLRYTGPNGKYFHVAISVSGRTNNALVNYQLGLFKNANIAPIAGTYFNIDFIATASETSAAFHKVISPNTNDTFYIKIKAGSANTTVTYNNVNLVFMACCN